MGKLLMLGCFLCLSVFVMGHNAFALEPSFSPAFKTVGHWDKARSERVDVNVWYPTKSKPSLATYGPWRLQVVRYGKAAEGRFPLIVLSHDSAASRFSYHDTAAYLASFGFVVMAPDHKYDNFQRMEHVFQWRQWQERLREIDTVLDMAHGHDEVRGMIDDSRIGLLAFGTGASTGLLLHGALPDIKGWDNYCVRVPGATAYCNAWAKDHVEKMLTTLPNFSESALDSVGYADARIKALVAVSPKYDFLFTQKALQKISRPLMVVEAEKESGKKAWDANNVQELFPEQTAFYSIAGVESRDFMAPCPAALRNDLPDLCGTASVEVRKEAHASFYQYIIPFFLEQLGHRAE